MSVSLAILVGCGHPLCPQMPAADTEDRTQPDSRPRRPEVRLRGGDADHLDVDVIGGEDPGSVSKGDL